MKTKVLFCCNGVFGSISCELTGWPDVIQAGDELKLECFCLKYSAAEVQKRSFSSDGEISLRCFVSKDFYDYLLTKSKPVKDFKGFYEIPNEHWPQ